MEGNLKLDNNKQEPAEDLKIFWGFLGSNLNLNYICIAAQLELCCNLFNFNYYKPTIHCFELTLKILQDDCAISGG